MNENDNNNNKSIIKHKETYQLCVWRDQKPTFSQQDQLPRGTYQETAVQRAAFLHVGAA